MEEPVKTEHMNEPGLSKSRIIAVFLLGLVLSIGLMSLLDHVISTYIFDNLISRYDIRTIFKIIDMVQRLYLMISLFSAMALAYISTWIKPVHETARSWFNSYFNRNVILILLVGCAITMMLNFSEIFIDERFRFIKNFPFFFSILWIYIRNQEYGRRTRKLNKF